MTKSLVIVESPAKAKTISKILGKDYQVMPSVGHVRDLPRNKLGVNVRKNFEPQYEVLPDKEKTVKELREAATDADKVYLAPDPDREGEAIAWHLYEVLDVQVMTARELIIAEMEELNIKGWDPSQLSDPARMKQVLKGKADLVKLYEDLREKEAARNKKLQRIEFNEITKDAVLAALKMPRQIDQRLVDAQQARRVLDRLVGYKISPLLWRKVNGRSAGRVQSVAVRLICERESEIESFNAREYWSIKAELSRSRSKQAFIAPLSKWQGKRVIAASDKATAQSMVVETEKEANGIVKAIEPEEFVVSSVNEKASQRQPLPPFITSTLQREAANSLGFAVKKTMQVAQFLYEGVELGAAGPSGLITYMRTDSTRVAQPAQEEALTYIEQRYGKDYVPDKPRIYTRKAKSVQDAHEAIRPTSVERTPESIKQYLSNDQFKLYKLIWERFMASQMASAEVLTRTVEISAGEGIFRVSASEMKFPGFTIVYNRPKNGESDSESSEEQDEETDSLPELTKGETLKLKSLKPNQHFTQPPPRYSEASLVKTLEELGIGRPSTYAATVNTIIDRKYVEKQQKMLCPTKLGKAVNLLLVEHFGAIVDVGFTAEMEEKLDQIEEDKVDWHGMLKIFYQPFNETLKKAEENMNKVVILSDQKCPACSQPMAIRSSRFGQFLGCVGYPECKTKIALTRDGKPVPEDRPSDEVCTTCGGPMLIRYGRYGDYLACASDECKEQRPILKTTGVMCPRTECGGQIVEKKSRRGKVFFGCSHYSQNQCNSAFWYPPVISGGPNGSNLCPTCGSMLVYKTLKRGDQLACSKKECTFAQPATGEEKHA